MIIVIDHFDSFVETLARYTREAGHETRIMRQDNDADAVLALQPQAIILSPGPGRPDATGLTLPLLKKLPASMPVLGICLGHQALAQHLGGTIAHALIVETLPPNCVALAHSQTGENMAFKHKTRPLYGVQFHPESILTPDGRRMMDNFLSLTQGRKDAA
jgi:anthranilate/para-aminobenzoate synthase component II